MPDDTELPDGGSNPTPPPNAAVGAATGQPLTPPATATPPAAPPPATEPKVLGHGGQPMTDEAISDRVRRATASQMRAIFGEDIDVEAAKALVAKAKSTVALTPDEAKEFDRLKRLEESRTRARLTAEERAKQELEAKDRRIQELEEERKARLQQEAVNAQDRAIEGAASEVVDPLYLDDAKAALARHVRQLQKEKPEEFAKFGAAQMKKFFTKLVEQKPAFKRAAQTPETATEPEAPKPGSSASTPTKRVVTTTRTSPRAPAPPTGTDQPGYYNGKRIQPGHPDSMNRHEARAYAKSIGVRLPY